MGIPLNRIAQTPQRAARRGISWIESIWQLNEMLSTIYIQTLVAMLLMGCATGGTVKSINLNNLESIEIGRTERPGCEGVDGFSLVRKNQDGLVKILKRQAISRGGNFVKVTTYRIGSITGKVNISGIVMICPVVKRAKPKKTKLPRPCQKRRMPIPSNS
jgi:hypothetical protein